MIAMKDPVLLSVEAAEEAAQRYEALANPIRLRILSILLSHAEGTVHMQELEALCGYQVHQPSVSFHVKKLVRSGFVELEAKRGLYRYYRVKREAVAEMQSLLSLLLGQGEAQ